MLTVETIGRIRREHFLKGKTIKEIARDLKGVPQHGPQGDRGRRHLNMSGPFSAGRNWAGGHPSSRSCFQAIRPNLRESS
jgi:hypothetical protein